MANSTKLIESATKPFDLGATAKPIITPQMKQDGWSNIIKSIGTGQDSRTSSGFRRNIQEGMLTKEVLSDMYMLDGIAQRIINLPAQDAFRQWGVVQNDPVKAYDEGEITFELNRLNVKTHFTDAKKWARLMGGALVYIGAMGAGRPEKPLEVERIKSIEFLKVFDLGDIQTWDCEFNTDPGDANYGNIEVYSLRSRIGREITTQYIHHTRCIPFTGLKLPPSAAWRQDWETRYWGVSVLQPMYADIRDFRLAFANTSGILQEFITSVYKFEDLDEMLASGNSQRFQTRMMAIEQSKSLINAVLMGKEEEYLRSSAAVSGLDELLDRFMMLVSAVSGIPVTRLFGRSASGLNATGEGDAAQYYDVIAAEQNELTTEMQKFITMIAAWKGLDIKGDYSWSWNSLIQLSDAEKADEKRKDAEMFRTKADGYRTYMQEGVITNEDAYKLEFEAILGKRSSSEFEEPEEDLDDNGTTEILPDPSKKEPKPSKKERK